MHALLRRPLLPLKVLTVSARVALWLAILAWLAIFAAWLALHFFIVPRIGELRPELEARASQALGVRVSIGAIAAHTQDHLLPAFELRDVRLHDRQGRPALHLPRVLATLSPRSLLKLGFEQLAIEQPELSVRRDVEGRIHVAGIELQAQATGDRSAADWVFSQSEWIILGGRLQWQDELRGSPALELHGLDLRLRNGAGRHEFRLDATPPAELGARFSLRAQLRQPLLWARAGDWTSWSGQLYAVFERVDAAQLLRHLPLKLDVSGGSGALRAWVDVNEGRITGAAADLALAQLGWRLGHDLPRLELQRLSGRIGGRTIGGALEGYTQGLQFDTREGLHWPGGDVRVTYEPASAESSGGGQLQASGIDLATLAQLTQRLPVDRRVHDALEQYRPKGKLEQLRARWTGPWNAVQKYEAKGRLAGLEVASQRVPKPDIEASKAEPTEPEQLVLGTPGVRGLTLDFEFDQDSGRAGLQLQQGYVELPGIFDDPRIDLDSLAAEVRWKRQGHRFQLQVANARLSSPDAQGDFQLNWQTDAAGHLPGELDLQGQLGRAELVAVHRYLPRAIPLQVRDYLRQALPQGRAGGVRFRVRGDLKDFPFEHPGRGEFRITAHVQDALFDYVPASLQPDQQARWPALADLHAELTIDHASLELRNIGARLAAAPQVRISRGEARIPDLAHEPVVQAQLHLVGPLEEQLRGLVSTSPLDAMLGGIFTNAHAAGAADVDLRLQLPLLALERSQVQGQIRLAGNELQLAPQLPRLTRARGTVHFSEQGFALQGVQARLLGGEARAQGGTITLPGEPAGTSARLRVQGTVTAQGMRQETHLVALTRLAQRMNGSASYAAEFGMRQGVPEFLFTSTLQGLGLDLPAPLNKPADAALPLRLQSVVMSADDAAASGSRPRDQLRVDMGRVFSARYVREYSDGRAQVLQGMVALGPQAADALSLPDAGVVANVHFEELDVDAWRALMAAPPSTGKPAPRTAAGTWQDYLPTAIMVQADAMVAGGQRITQLVGGGSREGETWRANLDAKELSGYLEYRAASEAGAGSVYARLARLVLAQDNARGVESLLQEQPISIPALDVVIDQLELRGKNLGRLEMDAVNVGAARRDGGAREWRLNKLTLTMPEASFSGSGSWAVYQEAAEPAARPTLRRAAPASPPRAETRRTVMDFKLDLADAGGLLGRLGMPGVVRAGKGQMQGQVSWVGSPMGLDYPSLGGQFSVNVEGGQFLKADPGMAKLLGVLSLQSLPRRLTLDFRDVFEEGFAFDYVRGDVRIEQGVALTNNLQMKGVNAAVLMEGHADLARETQELRVVVVPEINAGTASLLATWLNPAVGLGSFLAQLFLRGPLIAATTQELRVSGTWTEPQVSKVERAAPAPGTSGTGVSP